MANGKTSHAVVVGSSPRTDQPFFFFFFSIQKNRKNVFGSQNGPKMAKKLPKNVKIAGIALLHNWPDFGRKCLHSPVKIPQTGCTFMYKWLQNGSKMA